MRRLLLRLCAMVLGVLLLSGCIMDPGGQSSLISATGCGAATGTSPDIDAVQNQNAKAIADVALGLGLGEKGVLVGITVALAESTLGKGKPYGQFNVGDVMNGVPTSSVGLFQQIGAWGPLADRLDPTKSATMFYKGGQAGQQGLMQVTGWETMPVPQAAQKVEKSQHADGSNYARQLALATNVTAALLGGGGVTAVSACTGPGTGAVVNGVNVTIPDNPNVVAAARGKVIVAPNAQMAKGLSAGMGSGILGLQYVWGGGGDGAGPNDGCTRGGGDLNSCQGIIGFDCSGLTAWVYVQGGMASPGGNSSAQRGGGQSVSYDAGMPGDIVGFPGHVAIYLGKIDGVPYILEASTVGTPIHVVPLTRGDKDPVLHRYWGMGGLQA